MCLSLLLFLFYAASSNFFAAWRDDAQLRTGFLQEGASQSLDLFAQFGHLFQVQALVGIQPLLQE